MLLTGAIDLEVGVRAELEDAGKLAVTCCLPPVVFESENGAGRLFVF